MVKLQLPGLLYLIPGAVAFIATIFLVIPSSAPGDYEWKASISPSRVSAVKFTKTGGGIPASNKSKRKAILHIGPHKVASSYIQAKLCGEQDLLESIGFTVPIAKACKRCSGKHFAGVAFELQGSKEKGEKFSCSPEPVKDLTDFLKSHSGSIILSSEEFDNLDEKGVAQLADILSEYDTTVVMYYRHKLEHFISYYTQFNKFEPLPMSFLEFFWKFFSNLDPNAPGSCMNGGGGLCYKQLVELYGQQFGRENLVIINYNGLLNAGLDPWSVLVQDVVGFKDYQPPNNNDKRVNPSPDPFLMSVAAHYFYSDWLNGTISSPLKENETSPELRCMLPLLKPLEKILPKFCSNLYSVCSLWELYELELFTGLKGTSTLLHFDMDSNGHVVYEHTDHVVCEVDTAKLETDGNKMEYYSALERVAAAIRDRCPGNLKRRRY